MIARTDDPGARRTDLGGRRVLVVLCFTIPIVLFGVGYEIIFRPPFRVTPLLGLSFWLYLLTGVVFAVRAWRHRDLDRRTRQAWGMVAAGYVLFFASAALRPSFALGVDFPSPADILRLLFTPFMLVGLLMLPLRAQGRRERHKAWLDTGIVSIASSMLVWFVVTLSGGAFKQLGAGAMAAAVAYPVSDLVLIFGAGVVLLRGGARSAQGAATLLGGGMLFLLLGDVFLSYELAQGTGGQSSPWQWICWIIAHFLLALAPVMQWRQAGRHQLQTEEPRARAVNALPYVAIGLGYLLLLTSVLDVSVRVIGLVLGAFSMTAVAVVRQIVALRENHELAITDTLTGLANRRHFYDRLSLALARSARNRQAVAVLLIDMNGFKHVNDTMGHNAGDQLLVAFGKTLQRNVLGMDVVGRLGGDEFAVVLHNVGSVDNARAVVERIVADMQTPIMIDDSLLQPQASIGIAQSGPGHLTAEELLRRADAAMYEAKAKARQTGTTEVAAYFDDLAKTA
jgi:diguanylate cyclase (GGDEF)-like protein